MEPPTEDQFAEIREIFSLFDKDCDGFVNIDELGTMLRSLNMNPTDSEVDQLKKDVDQAKLGKFDQNAFIAIALKRGKDHETVDDLMEALTILTSEGDKATTIRVETLKHYMVGKGEPIPASDFDEVIADFDIVHDESMSIEELAKLLLSK